MEKLVIITNTELVELISSCVRNVLLEERTHIPPSSQDQSDILTHRQASDFLHMSEQTLYGYCHRLQIPYLKGGGDPSRKKAPNLFSKRELTLWLQNGRQLTKEQIEALQSIHHLKK